MKAILLAIILGMALLSPVVNAVAYTPKQDSEVLERLPIATVERKRLRQQRLQLAKNPGDYRLALDSAKQNIALGRLHSDPRYYGYAEVILNPWLNSENSYPDALVLRATVLQNRHNFQSALSDLHAALKINPRLPQAWLTLAAIQEVQGDYPAALTSCMALTRLSSSLTAAACIHSALSLSGQAQSSYEQLVAAIDNSDSTAEELTWIYTILAEMAERLNLSKEAESWYQKAMAIRYRSVYLLTAYADFLLDHNRSADVIGLLQEEIQADALLLRLTLAEQRLHSQQFAEHARLIKGRIAAAKDRGDTVHQGDESRFTLQVLNDAPTALELALNNWAVQKEPRDARLLLEAALAAKKPDAALPVIQFLDQTRLEDVRLQPLIRFAKG